MTALPSDFRSGFAAIVGAPNVGKSTLLNRLLGQKVAITSPKPQTTRNRIMGVVHRPGAQIVFLDTPGIHLARGPLNQRIVDVALSAIADVDLIVFVIDAARPDTEAETLLVRRLESRRGPVILALNKCDRIAKLALLPLIERWSRACDCAEIVPISARLSDQIETLLQAMEKHLPAGPPYFPEDTLTDMPERFLAGEIVREKVFRLTGQEVPYASAVTVDTFSERKGGGLVRIRATIHVERETQKGIVIGRGGRKLKQIGEAARKSIERMLGTRVYLELFVRVQKNWSKDAKTLRRFGY